MNGVNYMPVYGIDAPVQPLNVNPVDTITPARNMASLQQLNGQNKMLPSVAQAQQLENQQRQQAIQQQAQKGPLEVQQLQQTNQEQQIKLQDQQRMQDYWQNPEKYQDQPTGVPATGVSPATPKPGFAEQMLGLDSSDPLAKQANGMIRAGVTPGAVGQTAQSILAIRANVLKQTADNQKVIKDGLDTFGKVITPIIAETDPTKRAQMLQDAEPQLQKLSSFDPTLHQAVMTADPAHLEHISNLIGGVSDVVDFGTKKAKELESQEKSAVPDQKFQIPNAVAIIQSYTNIPPQLRAGLVQQAKMAPTVDALDKVLSTADATDKSEQMHADSLAQTKALVGNKFGEAGLTANDKIWTDPAHGFAGALAQAKQTKQAIVAGADGNGLMTSMVPTMEVLGINHAAGINRISPQEAAAAGAPGGWAEKWNAWADKATKGKLSAQLAEQGQQLMDVVLNAAYQRAVVSSQMIAKSHGLTPDQTPAMTKDGTVTTLDKVMSGAPKLVTMKAPNGQTKQVSPDQVDHFKQMGAVLVP